MYSYIYIYIFFWGGGGGGGAIKLDIKTNRNKLQIHKKKKLLTFMIFDSFCFYHKSFSQFPINKFAKWVFNNEAFSHTKVA